MAIERFEQLEAWREAHELTLAVYRGTTKLPSDEKFGIVSQIRRAAVSVPANIAEGFKRRSIRDKAHFYNIAQGSLEEVRYLALLCRDLGFDVPHDDLASRSDRVGRLLNGLVRSTRAS